MKKKKKEDLIQFFFNYLSVLQIHWACLLVVSLGFHLQLQQNWLWIFSWSTSKKLWIFILKMKGNILIVEVQTSSVQNLICWNHTFKSLVGVTNDNWRLTEMQRPSFENLRLRLINDLTRRQKNETDHKGFWDFETHDVQGTTNHLSFLLLNCSVCTVFAKLETS